MWAATFARCVLLASLAWMLLACAPARYPETARYTRQDLEGFPAFVSPRAMVEPETGAALAVFRVRLAAFRARLPSDVYGLLSTVPIWIEYREPGRAMAGYHGASWVASHRLNPDKARCIEIADLHAFAVALSGDSPMALVHELAHAYLDRAIRDAGAVEYAYASAVRSGRYDHVHTRRGTIERAYALESVGEYFAELTEAYFGDNDYEPFDRDELSRFDPPGFALMRSVWGE
jgi:hypothetical protein